MSRSRAKRVLGPLVLAPTTVAVLGIGLVVDSDVWDFGQLWLQLGLGLFAAALLIGAIWLSRAALEATPVYVDYETLERIPKASYYWYRDLIAGAAGPTAPVSSA